MPRAYIKPSVASFYAARPARQLALLAKQQATKDRWDAGCSGFKIVSSLETLDEVATSESEERLALVAELPLLEVIEDVADLANDMVLSGRVPTTAASNAIHIAIASVHRVELPPLTERSRRCRMLNSQ